MTPAPGTRRAPGLSRQPAIAGALPPEQLHLTFGGDGAREMAVSWATPARVSHPALSLGDAAGDFGTHWPAEERFSTDALTGELIWTYHARLSGLEPDRAYRYLVHHRGGEPVGSGFHTAPEGRSRRFRFTSFGDQSIPAPVGRVPSGRGPWSRNAGYVVDAVEAAEPLFHLVTGDLCYANISDAPAATWASWFTNAMRSARNRPWMPCAGNHENEVGNGPQGFCAYQTRFALPPGGIGDFLGNWYTFTAGSVAVISISNDDVCLQDGGFSSYRRDHLPGYRSRRLDPYIVGYSAGAQKRWLAGSLARARTNPGIDWVVVCMHQPAISSARFSGADLGVRREWLPLFDRYGVDLVVAGHEHHYERSFPVRGVVAGTGLLTPKATGSDPHVLDTTLGAVHLTLGGGGHPEVTREIAFGGLAPEGIVTVGVGRGGPRSQRPPIRETEPADWSAYRCLSAPYGFATFDVDPVAGDGMTTITVTYHGAASGSPDYRPVDSFVLRRPTRKPGGEMV